MSGKTGKRSNEEIPFRARPQPPVGPVTSLLLNPTGLLYEM